MSLVLACSLVRALTCTDQASYALHLASRRSLGQQQGSKLPRLFRTEA